MTDSPPLDELFATWRKQVQAGTEAWSDAVQQMGRQGQAPATPPDPMAFWQQFTNAGAPPWAAFQGSGPVNPAVLAEWKKFLDDWLAAWTRALEQAMGTEAFAAALGKTLDQFLTVQGKVKQAAERSNKTTLAALGLPTREQVVGLSRQLMDLEDRFEALSDKLDALAASGPGAARTRAKKKTGGGKTTRTRRAAGE